MNMAMRDPSKAFHKGISLCTHPTMSFHSRERDCGRRRSSTKMGTVTEGSKLGCQDWIIAVFLRTTDLKGISSMKLQRDLAITQKSVWFLVHRLRDALSQGDIVGAFSDPGEVGETYFGDERRNMPNPKRNELAVRGAVGKAAVGGAEDRATKQVAARVVVSTDKDTLQGFVENHAAEGSRVYTDDASAYDALPFDHASVTHSLSECVKGNVHTNGIESLWWMLKRAHKGRFHKWNPTHLNRYVQEFAGRYNIRALDTINQTASMRDGMESEWLPCTQLIANSGLAWSAPA